MTPARCIKAGTLSVLAALFAAITTTTSLANTAGLVLRQTAFDGVTVPLSEKGTEPVKLSDLLQVFVARSDGCCDGRIPMAGRSKRRGDALTFWPAFGRESGQDYVARLRTTESEVFVPFRLSSATAAAPDAVTQIFPSSFILPENVLRF